MRVIMWSPVVKSAAKLEELIRTQKCDLSTCECQSHLMREVRHVACYALIISSSFFESRSCSCCILRSSVCCHSSSRRLLSFCRCSLCRLSARRTCLLNFADALSSLQQLLLQVASSAFFCFLAKYNEMIDRINESAAPVPIMPLNVAETSDKTEAKMTARANGYTIPTRDIQVHSHRQGRFYTEYRNL